MKKIVIFIVGIIFLLIIIIVIIYFTKNSIKVVPNNECDDKSFIKQIRFGENDITLIGNFESSAVYNQDNTHDPSFVYSSGTARLKINQVLRTYLTEECISTFELINLTTEKAVIKHQEGCNPPGPPEKKECFFEVLR